ncbi:spore coat protein [Brevibacillus brevis]|uniref:Spore coat protein n=1 Tax=Brevibacillus brevis TaxID=1393 RepID=A0ABY9T1Y2_BREBE|nr:spore coat protein [Brevibacillus brevis]WNC14115.1 spore coat protein [Brevibacillus brevis]
MQLGIHEACELNELLMSCTNSIQSMALFINQAQDPELRDMILRHFSVHVQDYNMKVEFATQPNGSHDQLNVPPLQQAGTVAMAAAPQPITPQVKLSQLDDRAIATSYLLTLKRAGRDYAWGTFECTVPSLRSFLEDAFRMCSHQAYEVWSYMVRKGWYPAIAAPMEAMHAMGQVYQKVQAHEPMAVYS